MPCWLPEAGTSINLTSWVSSEWLLRRPAAYLEPELLRLELCAGLPSGSLRTGLFGAFPLPARIPAWPDLASHRQRQRNVCPGRYSSCFLRTDWVVGQGSDRLTPGGCHHLQRSVAGHPAGAGCITEALQKSWATEQTVRWEQVTYHLFGDCGLAKDYVSRVLYYSQSAPDQ